jgi:hypothetical protein
VPEDEHPASQERSAAIFGNRHFAEVVLAVNRLSAADDAFVTTRMVASETTLVDSLVRPVMRRLDAAGLLAALPRTAGPRSTLNYQVMRGGLWTAIVGACGETISEGKAQSPGSSSLSSEEHRST